MLKHCPLDSLGARRRRQRASVAPIAAEVKPGQEACEVDVGCRQTFVGFRLSELEGFNQRVVVVTANFAVEEDTNDSSKRGGLVFVEVDDVKLHVVEVAVYRVLGWCVQVELCGREQTLRAIGEINLKFSIADVGHDSVCISRCCRSYHVLVAKPVYLHKIRTFCT